MKIDSRLIASWLVLALMVTATSASDVTSDDIDLQDMISGLQSRDFSDGLYNGMGLSLCRRELVGGELGREFVIEFDQMQSDVWRIRTAGKTDSAANFALNVVTNGEFSFDANDRGTEQSYFGKLGFDQEVRMKNKERWRSQVPMAVLCRSVIGVPIRPFLEGLKKVDCVVSPAGEHAGMSIVRVSFDGPSLTGEIDMMPENDYLIRRQHIMLKSQTEGEQKKLVDATLDYKKIDGRLLPWRVLEKYGTAGNERVYEVSEFRKANPDPNYYTAESIGLTTPSKPWKPWQKFALLASVCLFVGMFFRARSSKEIAER